MNFQIIVATDCDGGIGKNNSIPWKLKEDLNRFKTITTNCPFKEKQNCIIMGRKTWESIGRFLPNRINIVLSSNDDLANRYKSGNDSTSFIFTNGPDFIAKDLESLYSWLEDNKHKIHKKFIIGGSQLYNTFLDNNKVNTVHLTILKDSYQCDTFFDLNKVYNNFKITYIGPKENYVNLIFHNRNEVD